MAQKAVIPGALLLLLGYAGGMMLPEWGDSGVLTALAARQPDTDPNADLSPSGLEEDVETLKQKAPDQAHAMVSVAYHFNNLWFAAEAENWPLAQFYWNEVRSHLRWAVRIIPVRKDNSGQEVKLENILEGFENAPLKQLQQAIEAQDREAFGKAYRFALEGCYACHKASDKPYLRPRIPETPDEATINFDPHASWPR